jgi:hypothetical protein
MKLLKQNLPLTMVAILIGLVLYCIGALIWRAHSATDASAAQAAAEEWLQENVDKAIAARSLLEEKDREEKILAIYGCSFDWNTRKKDCPKAQ